MSMDLKHLMLMLALVACKYASTSIYKYIMYNANYMY